MWLTEQKNAMQVQSPGYLSDLISPSLRWADQRPRALPGCAHAGESNLLLGQLPACDHPPGEGADKSWPELLAQGNRSLTIRESSTESSMPWKDGSPRTSPQDKLAFIKGNVGLSAYQLETAPHQPGLDIFYGIFIDR